MPLVDRWNHVERALDPRWTEVTLSLAIKDDDARSRAAALLGPAGPGIGSNEIRFTVSTQGAGIGPEATRRLLRRIDEEGIGGRLELVETRRPATGVRSSPGARLRARGRRRWRPCPSDWSDLVAELELDSSADIDRAAVLCAPINPMQLSTGRPGFRFRCASQRGYGASAGMVGRCLARLDEAEITGRVRITRRPERRPAARDSGCDLRRSVAAPPDGRLRSLDRGKENAMNGLSDAAQRVADHARSFVQLEVQLASAELKRKAPRSASGSASWSRRAVLAFLAVTFGLLAAAAGLATTLSVWASLLIVCGALILITAILVMVGYFMLQKGAQPMPEQAVEEAQLAAEALRDAE